jgi:hypothetical protein
LKGLVLSSTGISMRLEGDFQPVHQLRIRLDMRDGAGTTVRPTLYVTINALP